MTSGVWAGFTLDVAFGVWLGFTLAVTSGVWLGFTLDVAFGVGLDRLAMFKYGITDLRNIYTNDIRLLNNFNRKETK